MQRFKKAAAAQGTLSSRDLKDIKMRDNVGQLDDLLRQVMGLFFFSLISSNGPKVQLLHP